MKNTGTTYEQLVKEIYDFIYSNHPGATIEHDVHLPSRYGPRQFDVLITLPSADFDLKIPIECKDYQSKISVEKIDAFDSKLSDVRAAKGIMISRSGFQEAAILKAKDLDIQLYTLDKAENIKDLDLTLECLIQVVQPGQLIIETPYQRNELLEGMRSLPDPIINGYKVHELVAKHWKSNSLIYKIEPGVQEIHIPEVYSPYKMAVLDKTGIHRQINLENLKMSMLFEVKTYKCQFRDLKGATGFKDILKEGFFNVFINNAVIENSIQNLKEVEFDTLKHWNGFRYILRKRQGSKFVKEISFRVEPIVTTKL